MRVTPYFATPLCWEKLSGIDNSDIENYCYKLKDTFPGMPKAGGWQSGMLDLSASELAPVVDNIKQMMLDIALLYDLNANYVLELSNGWININSPGLDQLPNNYFHLHPNFFFSFVYYVKGTPQSGNLSLRSPYNTLKYTVPDKFKQGNPGLFDSSVTNINPEPSMLVGFPSWIEHYANPNNGTEDRISIAFNANITALNE